MSISLFVFGKVYKNRYIIIENLYINLFHNSYKFI